MNGIKECKDSGASPQGTGNEGALTESCFKSEVSLKRGLFIFSYRKELQRACFCFGFPLGNIKGENKGNSEPLSLSFFFFCHRPLSRQSKFRSTSEVLVCSSACPMPPWRGRQSWRCFFSQDPEEGDLFLESERNFSQQREEMCSRSHGTCWEQQPYQVSWSNPGFDTSKLCDLGKLLNLYVSLSPYI